MDTAITDTVIMETQSQSTVIMDPSDAPPGFYAVRKRDVASDGLGNICRACDWRSQCSGHEYRCMSYPIISDRDGRVLQRRDGCSVVFKRVPPKVSSDSPSL